MTSDPTSSSDPASPTASRRPRPIVLLILDGFGLGRRPDADAIAAAAMPVWRGLMARWPHARLGASEGAVGLPSGQMGNSEVGHLNIGAGRPVLQDLPRIDAAIEDGSFDAAPAFLDAFERAAKAGSAVHLVGLIGPGGVHAHDRHIVALARLANRHGVQRVLIHALLDGRDTPPRSAVGFVESLMERLASVHSGARIATIGGRYYGMDRDTRWERTTVAFQAIVHGVAPYRAATVGAAIGAAYERGEGDEFITPTTIGSPEPLAPDDEVIHANFRADRARQLTHALADATFDAFERASPDGRVFPTGLGVTTMTEYEAGLGARVAFAPAVVRSLAGTFSDMGWTQLHVAETEKYAHVTYFLNGGREEPFAGEDRVLVPSPKVATYDLEPAMSARGVADAVVEGIRGGGYDFIVANFANADMVGHTGDWDATVAGLAAVDAALGSITSALGLLDEASAASPPDPAGPALLVTADHGNADELRDEAGNPVTAHSLNPVPLLIAGPCVAGRRLRDGVLADVASTILELSDIPPWEGMSGRSLLV